MIRFDDVTKIYDNANNETHALKNINLTVDKGEFLFIVGRSGAGKSTLTKLLIGEITPTAGNVYVNDVCVNKLPKKEIAYHRRTIGMVFQDFRLLENKTVYENVAFVLEIIGISAKHIRRRVPDALSRVGIAGKAHHYPHQLSGGEQQRVAVARAVVNNPGLIIADEPTGNLDPAISGDIMSMLLEINRSGTTVLVITHDKEMVNQFKKRVLLLERGTIVKDAERSAYNEIPLL